MKPRRTLAPLHVSDKGAVNPADYVGIVGQTFVKRERAALLQIGDHRWDRWSLGRLGCPHPVAAAALNRVIAQLRITTLAGLAERAQEIGTYKGMGVTAYWTVLAILREAGYDVVDVHHDDVTYETVKRRTRKHTRPRLRKQRRATPSTSPAGAVAPASHVGADL